MNMSSSKKEKSTVDEGDVQRHSNLINDWWDPNGSMKGLHSFNSIRVPFVRDGLVSEIERDKTSTPLANKKILDIGCGGGILSEGLARIGAIVTGVDASEDLIHLAKQHSHIDAKIAKNKPTYYCNTIEVIRSPEIIDRFIFVMYMTFFINEYVFAPSWPSHTIPKYLVYEVFITSTKSEMKLQKHSKEFSEHYDAVVASEIIEHVADKELFVKSCVEAVKPGGKIFITTPNRSRWTQVLGIFVAEYVLNVLPRGTHQYDKFTTPNEVTILLGRNNCQVELVKGITYNPFNNKWAWVNSHTLCFALQATKLNSSI